MVYIHIRYVLKEAKKEPLVCVFVKCLRKNATPSLCASKQLDKHSFAFAFKEITVSPHHLQIKYFDSAHSGDNSLLRL